MRNQLQLRVPAFSPYRQLWDEFDKMFEGFATPALNDASERFHLASDVEENDQAYLLSFDVPGVGKDDIKIEVTDNQLRVAGERKRETRSESGRFERSFGRFERTLVLPRNADLSNIEATHADGVLKILVPKAEGSKTRTIEIKSSQMSS